MTFVETIYNELGQTHNISTADFSTDWLKQSKSYYTSLKTRNIDASNGALVNLLNKLDEENELIKNKNNNQLNHVAVKNTALADKVALEIAQRSIKNNMANTNVKKRVWKAVENVLEKSDVRYSNGETASTIILI